MGESIRYTACFLFRVLCVLFQRALSTTGVPKGSTTRSIQARQANINVAALLPGAAPPRARSPQPGRTAQAPRPQPDAPRPKPDARFDSKKPADPERAGPKVDLEELRNVRQDLKFAPMPKGKSYAELEHKLGKNLEVQLTSDNGDTGGFRCRH
ncbi:uncharacterized protein LOC144877952 isoform X1 [Branchiostoma floridae x Branchiostoma japonicum]